jgi:hypothetical protein
MFGKNNQNLIKKIDKLSEELFNLKLELANYEYFKVGVLKNSDNIKDIQDQLKQKDNSTQTRQDHSIKDEFKIATQKHSNLPNIPWLFEIIHQPTHPGFASLSSDHKSRIWETIFTDLGIYHSTPETIPQLIETYELELINEIGILYLSKLESNQVIQLHDFKLMEESLKPIIIKIIKLVDEDSDIGDYKSSYNQDSNSIDIEVSIDADEIELNIPSAKYLDPKFINELIRQLDGNQNPLKGFFMLHTEYGYLLLHLNHYQKNMIEHILKLNNQQLLLQE